MKRIIFTYGRYKVPAIDMIITIRNITMNKNIEISPNPNLIGQMALATGGYSSYFPHHRITIPASA